MDCKNHAGVAATDRCAGCAEGFCENCLVEMHGQKYCSQCKYMNVKGTPAIVDESKVGTIPCEEAKQALTYALIGIVCFGIVLEPMAMAKAIKARNLIKADPELSGSGKATAALIISSIYVGLVGLGILAAILGNP